MSRGSFGVLMDSLCMGWLRSVGSIKLHVSLAEYRLFYRALLQKRPIILSVLLTVATPYHIRVSNIGDLCRVQTFTYEKRPLKETYTYQKRDMNRHASSPDLYIWKETFKKDLHKWQERNESNETWVESRLSLSIIFIWVKRREYKDGV